MRERASHPEHGVARQERHGSIVFVSDVHLAPARPAASALFFEFLRSHAHEARSLYILGDLFDYWIGDDDRSNPLQVATLRALATLARDGVQVLFMHGNRDFLVGSGAADDARMTLLPDPSVIDLFGQPVLLMHGDTLCTDDRAYQRYRRLVRNRPVQRSLGALPIGWRHAIARRLRAQSESGKRLKPAEIMDVNETAVAAAFRRSGAKVLIHGHTHRPARHAHTVDGELRERIVLPDWDEHGGFLRATAAGIEAVVV